MAMVWPFTPETCWLVVAPLFHAAGSIAVLSTIWNAGRHVLLPAFDPGAALDLIERERVTVTLVVPSMASYAREQAYCFYSPALIDNLERNWDARSRSL